MLDPFLHSHVLFLHVIHFFQKENADETLIIYYSLLIIARPKTSRQLSVSDCRLPTAQRFPLASCSRSIASNKALKFPFPKLFAPLRWMISKKSVGRSSTGLENSCKRYPSLSRSTRIPS